MTITTAGPLADKLTGVDWRGMFVPHVSLFEIVLRGSIIYLAVFALLRIARGRHVGQMGIADILVIVLIADAVSNGMASEYRSIPEALVLAATIFFWSFALDWLGFHISWLRRILEPGPRCLIRDGRIQRDAMHYELLTRDNLMALLREHGVDNVASVRRAYIEGDGSVSVLCYDEKDVPPPEKKRIL